MARITHPELGAVIADLGAIRRDQRHTWRVAQRITARAGSRPHATVPVTHDELKVLLRAAEHQAALAEHIAALLSRAARSPSEDPALPGRGRACSRHDDRARRPDLQPRHWRGRARA